ncbi:MAG: hypothetical protein K2W95_23930 [Candidatus Obscuribacterales bacterium]|nr:hypothetical protein [Candidatus Obscuribacterales bacterium]
MTASLAGNIEDFEFKRVQSDQTDLPPAIASLRRTSTDDGTTIKASKWILNPTLDYLLACGGLVWILFGLHYFVLAGSTQGPAVQSLLTISSLGALLIGESHTAATLVHTYRSAELRNRFAFYTKFLPLLFCAIAAAGSFIPGVAAVLVKLYLLIVPHHFMAQSYGIARVYCVKHNYILQDDEHRALILLTWTTTLFAMVRQLTAFEVPQPFLSQAVPQWAILPIPVFDLARIALLASIVMFVAVVALRATREKRILPLPALLTMTTGITAFSLMNSAHGIYWLYVSAFFHGTQYFLTVLASHWNEQKIVSGESRIKSLVTNSPTTRLIGLTLLVSVFLYIGLPRILESMGCNFLLVMASVFTVLNFHHTAVDSVIWKLRRREVREAVST